MAKIGKTNNIKCCRDLESYKELALSHILEQP